MGPEIIVIFIVFATIFGIAYLYYSTRNKERMALIERGADVDIFIKNKSGKTSSTLKYLFLSVALVVTGIGAGVFVGSILEAMGVHPDTAYPGSIFMLAGLGLFLSFQLSKDKEK